MSCLVSESVAGGSWQSRACALAVDGRGAGSSRHAASFVVVGGGGVPRARNHADAYDLPAAPPPRPHALASVVVSHAAGARASTSERRRRAIYRHRGDVG